MLYIHIGMGKAGSTALQYALDASGQRLSELHLDYPMVGRRNVNHHPLALGLQGGAAAGATLWGEMKDYLRDSPKDVVLSSEAFEGVEPGAVSETLSGIGAKIICYVRPPAVRLPSFYTQNTKYGLNVADFDTFYKNQNVSTNRKWRYADFIQPWAAAFGPENVRIRSLESDLLEGGDLFVDFLHAVGRPVDSHGFSEPAVDGLSNESPGWKLVEALRQLHAHSVGGGKAMSKHSDPALWSYLRRVFSIGSKVANDLGWTERGAYLTDSQYDELEQLHHDQCDAVESVGVDAKLNSAGGSRRAAREFLPSAEEIPAAEHLRFLEEVAPQAIRLALASQRDSE